MIRRLQAGFTILELLVVIAIIGILSAIAIVALNSSREKAKTSAFKAEMSSLSKSLVAVCDDGTITAEDLAGGGSYEAFTSDPLDQSCGLSGNGTFSIDIVSNPGSACTSATITEEGITFTPAGC